MRRNGRASMRRHRGFSFIEIMVVVVIIGILAGAVALKVVGYTDAARVNRAKSDLATIVSAVEAYNMQYGRYPSADDGLKSLPLKTCVDPWGKNYGYNCPAKEEPFEVFTLGRDGRPGGESIDADIYSWQLGDAEKKE